MDEVLLLDENQARNKLNEHVDNSDEILDKIFCEPPENYLITSEDMVSKSGVWAHFGSWDFERAFIYNTIKSNTKNNAIEILKEELDYTQEQSESTYRQLNGLNDQEANIWIASYPGYSNSGQCQKQNETIVCSNGAIIDEDKAFLSTNDGQVPLKYFRDDSGTHTATEGSEEISVIYIEKDSMAILVNPPLLNSMFTELFFYEGKNLKHFELFDHQKAFNDFDIYTWKIKWTSQ